jgi:hypothetical protein
VKGFHIALPGTGFSKGIWAYFTPELSKVFNEGTFYLSSWDAPYKTQLIIKLNN